MMKKRIYLSVLIGFSLMALGAVSMSMNSTNSTIMVQQNSPQMISAKISSLNHEHVNISSDYEIVVGWEAEPPTQDVFNHVIVEVNMFTNGGANVTPVSGANLTIVISKGGSSMASQKLVESDETPGLYYVPLIPTQDGLYVTHITGTINATSVDETVNLDEVQPATAVAFPQVQVSTTPSIDSQLMPVTIGLFVTLIVAVAGVGFGYMNFRNLKKKT